MIRVGVGEYSIGHGALYGFSSIPTEYHVESENHRRRLAFTSKTKAVTTQPKKPRDTTPTTRSSTGPTLLAFGHRVRRPPAAVAELSPAAQPRQKWWKRSSTHNSTSSVAFERLAGVGGQGVRIK